MSIEIEDVAGLAATVPLQILVAEDNSIGQKLVNSILSKLGYSINIVPNGVEVLKAFDHANYDLVFMDLEMPEMGGIEATQKLVEKFKGSPKQPLVIALTSNVMEGEKKRCLDAGMKDYISKPFKLEDIYKAIKKWQPYLQGAENF